MTPDAAPYGEIIIFPVMPSVPPNYVEEWVSSPAGGKMPNPASGIALQNLSKVDNEL